MVARLTEDLGITRVAVFYQDDAYGQAGLEGTRLALERRGLEPVASGHYERNTAAVHGAVFHIVEANPAGRHIDRGLRSGCQDHHRDTQGHRPRLHGNILRGWATRWRGNSARAEREFYVTQVVPFPEDIDIPVVARYRDALVEYDPNAVPGFVSLGGLLWLDAWPSSDWNRAAASSAGSVSSTPSAMPAQLTLMELASTTVPRTTRGPTRFFITMLDANGKHIPVDKPRQRPLTELLRFRRRKS